MNATSAAREEKNQNRKNYSIEEERSNRRLMSINDQKRVWDSIGIRTLTEPPTLSTLINDNIQLMENRIIYAVTCRRTKAQKMFEIISSNVDTRNDHSSTLPKAMDWDELFDHRIMTDDSVLQLYTFDSPIAETCDTDSPRLPKQAREELVDLITTIASKYNDVYYHNFAHASHVTASAVTLIDFMIIEALRRTYELDGSHEDSVQDRASYNIVLDHIIPLAVCFAALVHDIDHQGVSNTQLIQEGFPLVKELKNTSIAESNSLILALDLLREERFYNLRECMFGRVDVLTDTTDNITDSTSLLLRQCQNFVACNDERRFRQAVASLIFSTDIFSPDRQRICKHKWMKGFGSADFSDSTTESFPSDLSYYDSLSQSLWGNQIPFAGRSIFDQDSLDQIRACSSLDHIIQAADVAPLFQDWDIYILWNRKLFNELWAAHSAGRGPLVTNNWYDGQIGFYDTYILPLTKRLSSSDLFGKIGNTFYENALALRSRWLEEGKACSESMHHYARSLIGEQR